MPCLLDDRLSNIQKKASEKGYDNETTRFFSQLIADFPEYNWRFHRKFSFRPPKTIMIGPPEPRARLLVLHELGHAISQHTSFNTDVERLKIEVEAWRKARKLATKYAVLIDENFIQDELDSYRNWLDQKSRCPKCGLTRFQTSDSTYHCPLCDQV